MNDELEAFSLSTLITLLRETRSDEEYSEFTYNVMALCDNWAGKELSSYSFINADGESEYLLSEGEHPIHCKFIWSDLDKAPISFRAREFIILTEIVDDLYWSTTADNKDPFKIAFLMAEILVWALEVSCNLVEEGQNQQSIDFVIKHTKGELEERNKASRSAGGQARASKYAKVSKIVREEALKMKERDPTATLDDLADYFLGDINKNHDKYGVDQYFEVRRSTIRQTWLKNLTKI